MSRCRAGSRCAGSPDHIAVEVGAPDTFCIACLDRTEGRVRVMPAQYGQLQLLLHITHHGDPGPGHSTPGSIVPINCHIDALIRDIAYTLELAGELVADLLGVPDPVGVDATAELVATHIHRLADLTPWPMLIWARAGTWRRLVTWPGVQVIETLDRLAQLAAAALGATRARARRDLPCTRCGAKTVGRWAGSDFYDCSTCGARWHRNDIQRQDRILIELHRRGKLRVP